MALYMNIRPFFVKSSLRSSYWMAPSLNYSYIKHPFVYLSYSIFCSAIYTYLMLDFQLKVLSVQDADGGFSWLGVWAVQAVARSRSSMNKPYCPSEPPVHHLLTWYST